MAEHIGGFLITNFKLNHRSLAPWRVLGIDECGEALPQKTARYARTFLGTPFSRRRSQAHATEKQTGMTGKPSKNRAPEKDLRSKDFLGRGDVTEQSGRVALASCRKAKFTATRKRSGAEPSPLTRLGIGSVFPAAHSFLILVLFP